MDIGQANRLYVGTNRMNIDYTAPVKAYLNGDEQFIHRYNSIIYPVKDIAYISYKTKTERDNSGALIGPILVPIIKIIPSGTKMITNSFEVPIDQDYEGVNPFGAHKTQDKIWADRLTAANIEIHSSVCNRYAFIDSRKCRALINPMQLDPEVKCNLELIKELNEE